MAKNLKLFYKYSGIPDGHSPRLRDTFSIDLLSHFALTPIEYVSKLIGHTSASQERHYALWFKARQDEREGPRQERGSEATERIKAVRKSVRGLLLQHSVRREHHLLSCEGEILPGAPTERDHYGVVYGSAAGTNA